MIERKITDMGRWVFVYSLMLCIYVSKDTQFTGVYNFPCSCSIGESIVLAQKKAETLTSMEALDLVQAKYAVNFEKVYQTDSEDYYYKLPIAEFYLIYEGTGETEKEYLIHLYEFVTDDQDTGIGHMVTYGWYTVNRETGEIIEYIDE